MGAGFTFPEIAAKAFATVIADSNTIEGKFLAWADNPLESALFSQLNSAWAAGGTRTLTNIPLRMLAVVNRLDLAVVAAKGSTVAKTRQTALLGEPSVRRRGAVCLRRVQRYQLDRSSR